MIQTSELRIGNWISFKGLWNGQVSELSEHHLLIKDNEGFFSPESFTPISLTPEILLACGFEKAGDENRNKYRKIIGMSIYEFYIRENLPAENPNCGIMGISYDEEDIETINGIHHHEEYSWNAFAWHVKYLHQFQNLVFALRGTELIINLK